MKKLLESTTDYVITHDKKEANELLKDFKDEATEEFMDNVLELDGLVQVLFGGDFIDGEPVVLKIKELLTLLDKSSIPKSTVYGTDLADCYHKIRLHQMLVFHHQGTRFPTS